MNDTLLTTTEAAIRLGVSGERVRQFIKAGRLPSQQFGRDHAIKEPDLALAAKRKTEKPSKKQSAGSDELSTATDAPFAVPVAGRQTIEWCALMRRCNDCIRQASRACGSSATAKHRMCKLTSKGNARRGVQSLMEAEIKAARSHN